ncbi:ComF family protein [Sporolactobacillus pectinivorans]|uniref:ComF family protein n=1 Tax=Sporolactobacillus pectinivorans TaxID=1591408 RepID=UPI001EFDF680|nr:phosphoribosyltransferase family protein [Sporolactobacillus pectinivorans]
MNGLKCLICGADRREPLTFRTLLSPETPPGFCRPCREKMAHIIPGDSCRLCGRDLGLLDGKFIRDSVCSDCVRWEEGNKNGCYDRNFALFSYNNWMKEVITTYKFRGDAAIAEGFRADFRTAGRKIIGKDPQSRWKRIKEGKWGAREDWAIVPIPISVTRLKERGFNQAEILAEMIGEPLVPALIRQGDERKQSKKGRRERLVSNNNPFILDETHVSLVHGKQVLLVDDIYTTGATLRRAAEALKKAVPRRVVSLTLAHG